MELKYVTRTGKKLKVYKTKMALILLEDQLEKDI